MLSDAYGNPWPSGIYVEINASFLGEVATAAGNDGPFIFSPLERKVKK